MIEYKNILRLCMKKNLKLISLAAVIAFCSALSFPLSSVVEVAFASSSKSVKEVLPSVYGLLFDNNLLFDDDNNDCAVRQACYDIVYVRYPDRDGGIDEFISIPQGERPYTLAIGADLMLLKKDGSEELLVDCTDCSVMDPTISFDGTTVYYSLNTQFRPDGQSGQDSFHSYIYKIDLTDPSYRPVRLTFDDGFDSINYAGNRQANGLIKAFHDQGDLREIRDMAPTPLADGRIMFTSNRSALTAFRPGTNAHSQSSVQQLYIVDDHDGTAVTNALSNLHRVETGNIHLVQHPMQLKDGRILFSTWQAIGVKFRYAMTTLFTVHPDGSNLQQFTEPHDDHRNVDHFISQLDNEDVVWGYYYPSFDYGFGVIMRAPLDPAGADFIRAVDTSVSFREFERVGAVNLTPHTTPADVPAPNQSGKYSMPSATVDGGLLVAYSKGYVNHFDAACRAIQGVRPNRCERLRSGIYLMTNATGSSNRFANQSDLIQDPDAQLIKIKDDDGFNEIWPRPVLSYNDIYGVAHPAILKDLRQQQPDSTLLAAGEAAGLVGTSSMYNREPLDEQNPDPFQTSTSRELADDNWLKQGADAGVFSNADIHGVRIVATPPKPFTSIISRFDPGNDRWESITRHLQDIRNERVVARYGSAHGERWEILGEFPVRKSGAVITDRLGDPDTSWRAKVPSDTPFLLQTIDENGMTLVSELTWRAVKSGEERTDCGGCHAHSTDVETLDFATTAAGNSRPISGISGLDEQPQVVAEHLWDLTLNQVPLLDEDGVQFKAGHSYGVEFNRDVKPILEAKCASCHTSGGNAELMILDGSGGQDAWSVISETGNFNLPQISRYIRTPQARQSLLVWVAWEERLDGRTNQTRNDDIDYPNDHPAIGLSDEDKRTIARWVDLGSPIDFPQTDGFGYTDDYQLPIVNIFTPTAGNNGNSILRAGFNDAKSGLDYSSLDVRYVAMNGAVTTALSQLENATDFEQALAQVRQLIVNASIPVTINVGNDIDAKHVLTKNLPLVTGEYLLFISIKDMVGNTGTASRRFSVN